MLVPGSAIPGHIDAGLLNLEASITLDQGAGNEAADEFGNAQTAGDFNGDDEKDLAGTPGETPGADDKAGAVKIVPASEVLP